MTYKAILFYGGQVVQRFERNDPIMLDYLLHTQWGYEVYNGGYLHWPEMEHFHGHAWYRPNMAIIPLADVPKEYRLLALIHS